jgi:hypothetical protein
LPDFKSGITIVLCDGYWYSQIKPGNMPVEIWQYSRTSIRKKIKNPAEAGLNVEGG